MQVNQPPSRAELNKTFKDFLQGNPSPSAALPTTPPPAFIDPDKVDSFEKNHAFAITTASLGFLATIGFFLVRGGKLGNFNNFVKKTVNKFTEISQNLFKSEKTINTLDNAKAHISVWIAKGLKKLQGLANVNPVKDYYADQAVQSKYLKPLKLKEFFNWMTNKFTSYGKKLAFSKYKAPQLHYQNLQQSLNDICAMVEKDPLKFFPSAQNAQEAVAAIRNLSAKSGQDLTSLINGFNGRFDKTVEVLNANSTREFLAEMKKIKGNTWRAKIFNKVDDFSEFIPYRTMKPYKDDLFRGLNATKAGISNSVLDLHGNVSTRLDDIFYSDLLYDKGFRANYSKIKELLAQFKEPKSFGLATRDGLKSKIEEEITSLVEALSKKSGAETYAQKAKELLEIIKADKKGAVEDAVAHCIFLKDKNPQLYAQLLKQRDKFQNVLNNAVNFETEKSYSKLLDFSLHSLATDVFTQVAGVGTLLYFLLNWKKTKEEKIAANLKTGIPIVGGLGVAFLCNLRQVASGPTALFLGVLASIALNKIGNFTNNKYLTSLKNKQLAAAPDQNKVATA